MNDTFKDSEKRAYWYTQMCYMPHWNLLAHSGLTSYLVFLVRILE